MNRLFFFFLCLISVAATAQQTKGIHFREEVFDFSNVKEDGGPVMHEFVFTNISGRPIKIISVQASCGCTTPAWSKEPVASGKSGFIQASYNPKGRPGFFNKTLTVTTDFDPNPVVLQIKGNVSTEGVGSEADFKVANGNWKFRNGSFNMGKVYLNEESTVRDFQFINASAKPVTASKIVAPEYIKVEVSPKTIASGERGHVTLVYNGKKRDRYGFQSDNIEIETDDTDNPTKSFTVYATLEENFSELKPEDMARAPRLVLSSSSLDFGRVGKNATVVREVNVTNSGKKDLAIRALQGNCTCVSASSAKSTLKPGESAVIKVSFDSQDRKATQQKAVTIYSNDPQNPVQRLTFTAYVED